MGRARTLARLVPTIVAALACAACATAGPRLSNNDAWSSTDRPPQVRLIVQNRNFSDARLYAVRRSARESLGIVGGKQDAEFMLEWPSPEPLRIEINMLAGPRCVTEEMQVDPGDILELQIAVVFTNTAGCR